MPGSAFEKGSVKRGRFASPTPEQRVRMGVAAESAEFGFGQYPFSNEGMKHYF
jgi:hypothetical protein